MKSLNAERKKKSKCCCTLYDKEGLQLFPEKNWYSIIYGKNAETTKLGTRDKRDFVLQSRNPLVPLCFCLFVFFFNGCRNCKCIFCLSFLIPQNGTYPYLFKYKLNCRPTPKKTSVPGGETHGETPVVNVLSATAIEKPSSQSSNPKPSQSVSPQQMLTEDSAASTSTAPPSRSTSTKPSVPDINATRDMINDLFSADEVVHSFYHCTETTCNYQKEKGKKKFDHAWIFRRDLTYDDWGSQI